MLNELISLFYPNNCACCNQVLTEQENTICITCLVDLPSTNYHEDSDNSVARLFWGRVQLGFGISSYQFDQKGKIQKLIHQLKYKDNTAVGEILGVELAKDIARADFAAGVDILIPVPIHNKKRKLRGYNQSEFIVTGMHKVLKTTTFSFDNLVRVTNTDSQTKKSKFSRWENVGSVFKVKKPELFENKHLLIVDDVITTGATIEGCVAVLQEIEGVTVSVAAIASGA